MKKVKYKEKPQINNKYELVEYLCKGKILKQIILNTAKWSYNELNDLENDIYVSLLEMDEEKLLRMYNDDSLRFFLSRIVTNNLISTTSPFYVKYKKLQSLSEEITPTFMDNY